jgi:hypothetical protein
VWNGQNGQNGRRGAQMSTRWHYRPPGNRGVRPLGAGERRLASRFAPRLRAGPARRQDLFPGKHSLSEVMSYLPSPFFASLTAFAVLSLT